MDVSGTTLYTVYEEVTVTFEPGNGDSATAVDLRKGSPTFGQWEAVTLTAENALQFFVPRGFAHGFVVLEDDTLFAYKCDNLYNPASERGLAWDDPTVAVKWPDPGADYLFSAKDRAHPKLSAIEPIEV